MVRNIVVLGGNSHPRFVESVCAILGVPPSNRTLTKFSGGESRCEIQDSVRGKDVYIIQSGGCGVGGDRVNDHFIELNIMISACKTGSAQRVTAIFPYFPYSRQPDSLDSKAGAPLPKQPTSGKTSAEYTFESVPVTPGPNVPRTAGMSSSVDMVNAMNHSPQASKYTTHNYENLSLVSSFESKPGYKQWVAQAGPLIANLLTCAGANRILTCDLHESTYQGFFDIPVDNLYGRGLLQRYIRQNIPKSKDAVIVSPDAGGAKRASKIADGMGLNFALIHKERRPTNINEPQNATMMLVGDVVNRVTILVDDMVDTANTITRAAKLLKNEGATQVYAVLTHGVFSGDAIARINASALDRVVVTNTVAQDEHCAQCPKLEVIDITPLFAEGIRRLHHGESISVLFQHGY